MSDTTTAAAAPATASAPAAEAPRPKPADISDFDTLELGEAGVAMPVRGPAAPYDQLYNADGSPMTITVASADSDKFQKASRSARDRRTQVGGRRGGQLAVPRAAEIDSDSIDLLVAVVVAWNVTIGGARPECKPAVVRQAYKNYPWLMRQVDSFIAEDANFLKPSAIL